MHYTLAVEKGLKGKVKWQSPSNIALVKYWGKHGVQLPNNPSISFTLKDAFSQTEVVYTAKDTPGVDFEFLFENELKPSFAEKIKNYLNSIEHYIPFLGHYSLRISSINSFPHSTGIASSASAMSALAICLCDIERKVSRERVSDEEFIQKASYLARLGSGSACRSLLPTLAIWGEHKGLQIGSNEQAIAYTEADPVFETFCDSILIVSSEEKGVSSRAGHGLMHENPFAPTRYQRANDHLEALLNAMQAGDVARFGDIVEAEALELHALMMTSTPSYVLMRPNTLAIIEKVRAYRAAMQIPLYFTLDAGPNVHLLYPAQYETIVKEFIATDLAMLCEDGKVLHDRVGDGAKKLD